MSIFNDNITNQVPQEVLADSLKNWIDKNFQHQWYSKQGNLENIEKAFNSTLQLPRTREFCEEYNVHHPWVVLQPVVDESLIGKVLITVMYFTINTHSVSSTINIHSVSRSILLQYKVPFPSSKF